MIIYIYPIEHLLCLSMTLQLCFLVFLQRIIIFFLFQTLNPKTSTMKLPPKDSENMKNHAFSKSIVCVLFLITIFYLFSSLGILNSSKPSTIGHPLTTFDHQYILDEQLVLLPQPPSPSNPTPNDTLTSYKNKTKVHQVVFGIAASAKTWDERQKYIKAWWSPGEMRGAVWLDKPVEISVQDEKLLPPLKISSNTSKFKYKHPKGDRSGIRLSRIVSETFRLGMKDVRWFVMCDDDTFFGVDNLIRVLNEYDHNQFQYIGATSESHLQNVKEFSNSMAYGGAGIAISYPLAKALAKMQDKCIKRYPALFGSDDRLHACMSELGVPLTKESGFHQLDVYGNAFGLLAAHPVAPFVSLHHLDKIDPIFPDVGGDKVEALKRLNIPIKLDSAALLQQSICYDKSRTWTISVSWGYAVQIIGGIVLPREMEKPERTFGNWHRNAGYTSLAFNTRGVPHNPCRAAFIYYLTNAVYNAKKNVTVSEYVKYIKSGVAIPRCNKWKKVADPSQIVQVEVYKKPNPSLWDKKHRRRNCCRVLPTERKDTLVVDVGECRENEIIGVHPL